MGDEDTAVAKKSKYFDPHQSDPCLSECRAQFYFVYKRINRYLVEDKGLYIEKSESFGNY